MGDLVSTVTSTLSQWGYYALPKTCKFVVALLGQVERVAGPLGVPLDAFLALAYAGAKL